MFDALSMEGPTISPVSGNPPKQLVMFLHGLGSDGNDLISLAPLFAPLLPDAQFVSPNAPYFCDMAPMGRQWFSLQSRETAHMLTGIEAAIPLLDNYIDEQLSLYGLSISQLIIVGFSQGTMMALHSMVRRSGACAGIIGFSGAIVGSANYDDQVVSKPPVCLIHGDADEVVPFAALPDAEAALLKSDIDVEAHAVEGLGHSIDQTGITAASNFIQRIIPQQIAA